MESRQINDFSKYKELLNNILKVSFENKLKTLEKRTKNHLESINSTKELTNRITSLTIKIHNQLLFKIKSDKRNNKLNSVSKKKKNTTFKNIYSPKPSNVKPRPGLKTPLDSSKKIIKVQSKTEANEKKIDSKIKLQLSYKKERKKSLIEKAKSFKNNKTNKSIEIYDKKLNKTFMHSFNKTKIDNTDLAEYSVSSFKIKEKEKNQIKGKSKNKINNLVNKTFISSKNKNDSKNIKKNLNKTFERKKSKNITSENSSITSQIINKNKRSKEKNKNMNNFQEYNSKTKNSKKKNKIRIISMEANLEKDSNLFEQDEPLLITPITDNDFQQSDLKPNKKESNEIQIMQNYFHKIDEKYFHNIFQYLDKNDLISLNGSTKFFNKKVLNYILKKLNERKNDLEKIKMITIYSSEPKNFKNFEFSIGGSKSIELLNESIMSNIFQKSTIPRDDILFIFKVFFQLINNPIKDLYNNNKKEFWDSCRKIFLTDGKGKIGNYLKDIIINNKIDISEDNLYKLYELVNDKLHIITPSYFNKVCSTTALITFYLKDILIFLGISIDNGDIQNGYWTYSNIINSINKKINFIIKYI